MTSTACFMIISKNDIPIYEAEVGAAPKKEDIAQQHQFILNAALDIVQDVAWTTSSISFSIQCMYLDRALPPLILIQRFELLQENISDPRLSSGRETKRALPKWRLHSGLQYYLLT
ncbi:hypothetical protein AgCh_015290 [Apium graveolens]